MQQVFIRQLCIYNIPSKTRLSKRLVVFRVKSSQFSLQFFKNHFLESMYSVFNKVYLFANASQKLCHALLINTEVAGFFMFIKKRPRREKNNNYCQLAMVCSAMLYGGSFQIMYQFNLTFIKYLVVSLPNFPFFISISAKPCCTLKFIEVNVATLLRNFKSYYQSYQGRFLLLDLSCSHFSSRFGVYPDN